MSGPVVLGTDIQTGEQVVLSAEARRQGTYAIGLQGSGKTNILIQTAVSDMDNGDGIALLSPHADFPEGALQRVPKHRQQDVILIDAGKKDPAPVGLDMFAWEGPESRIAIDTVTDRVVMEIFKRLWGDMWGPQMEQMLRQTARTILLAQGISKKHRPTMAEFSEVVGWLHDSNYRQLLLAHIQNTHHSVAAESVIKYWREFDNKTARRREEISSSTLNKARLFRENELISHVVGQGCMSRLDFRQIMDEGKILVVDLNIDELGPGNTELLGSLVVGQLFVAALSREIEPPPKQFHIIADEFGFFATPAFAALQDQARKFGVDVLVAHQRRDQLEPETKSATITARNWIILSVNPKDAADLAPGFDSTPPRQEVRGEKENLIYASYPWDILHHQGHELKEVMDIVNDIENILLVEAVWDLTETLGPQLGKKDWMYNLRLKVWGFPTPEERELFVRGLNRVLYLMMRGESGNQIEPLLLRLGETLFCWMDEYGIKRYTQAVSKNQGLVDPPLGSDWGQSAQVQIQRNIFSGRGAPIGKSRDEGREEHLQEYGPIFARIAMRRRYVLQIAHLGHLLNQHPLWHRGGQPEPEYEHPRTHADVTNEWQNVLTNLPKYEAWCRIAGVGEHHILTLEAPPTPEDGKQRAEQLRAASREKYGVPRAKIEQALKDRVRVFAAPYPQDNQGGYETDYGDREVPAGSR